MIENLLKQWQELNNIPARTVGAIDDKENRQIAIAQSLLQNGYTGTLDGFPPEFIIEDRLRNKRERNDTLNRL